MQTKPLGTRLGATETPRDVGVDPRTPHEPFETEAADLALRVLGTAAAQR